MASVQEVKETLIDDLDGSRAAESVRFAIDDNSYEIDLSKGNARKLRNSLRPFIEGARSARRPRASRRNGKPASSLRRRTASYDPAEVRAWAKAQRIKVALRGRLSAELVERWRASTKN